MNKEIITCIPCLRKKSLEINIGSINQLSLTLIEDMKKVLIEHGGLGLSAIQLGYPKRICIMKNNRGELLTIYNPKILDKYDPIIFYDEGCLSLPNIRVNTKRYKYVEVEYTDDNKRKQHILFEKKEAVVFQHEYDHCEGILITDRKQKSIRIIKIGRNELCPYCLKEGIRIKYKKCKRHFKN